MDALPDDPSCREYYEHLEFLRTTTRKVSYFNKLDKDMSLSQENICPICNEELYNGEPLHRHHIISKKDNGK